MTAVAPWFRIWNHIILAIFVIFRFIRRRMFVILVILIAATVAYRLTHVMTTDKGMISPPLRGQHPNLHRSL
jgi:hypothetical protein